MAPSSTSLSSHSLQVAVLILVVIFSLPCTSDCYASNSKVGLEERQKVLGSRPPECVNKCFNCRPCRATLVIPSHQHGDYKGFSLRSASLSKQEDDTYYLLSWKCRCGDKLFQP